MNPAHARAPGALSAEDAERIDFLKRLDHAPFEVSDWEAGFIENLITNPRSLTPAQRTACDEMRTEYEGKL